MVVSWDVLISHPHGGLLVTPQIWRLLRHNGQRPPLRGIHPFFPHPESETPCKFSIPVSFSENDGYAVGADGFILRKGDNWQRGYYQAPDDEARADLVILHKHQKLGFVAVTTSYIPDFFPIWGNTNTSSWEPFFEHSLAPRQAITRRIDCEF
jgi:hypothetical protein